MPCGGGEERARPCSRLELDIDTTTLDGATSATLAMASRRAANACWSSTKVSALLTFNKMVPVKSTTSSGRKLEELDAFVKSEPSSDALVDSSATTVVVAFRLQ